MKNTNDFLPRILLMAAIFLTAMYFMNVFVPQPPAKTTATNAPHPENKTGAPSELITTPAVQPATISTIETDNSASDFTPESTDSAAAAKEIPAAVYDQIKITREQYHAVFSTHGAALKSYQLNHFYDQPANIADRENLTLLAEMSSSARSLQLTRLAFLPVNGVSATLDFSQENWRLTAAPRDCHIDDPSVETTDNQLVFTTQRDNLRLRRVYDFSPIATDKNSDFGFRHSVIFENIGSAPLTLNAWEITGAAGILPDETDRSFGALKAISAYFGKNHKLHREENDVSKLLDESEFAHSNRHTAWVGFANRFFCSLLLTTPDQADSALTAKFTRLTVAPFFWQSHPRWQHLEQYHPAQGSAALTLAGFTLPPQAMLTRDFLYYGGPLDDDVAKKFSPSLSDIATFSWAFLKPISNFLLFILEYLAVITRNYGLAIVLLTLVVKIALHPLTRKSLKSQKAMQKIQPLLKEIKEKYGKDPQRQQQETMRIFKENGVNPVGGCLPMLLQMPIFFALYGVFARCFAMRQQSFIPGWIDDLSHPDTLFHLPAIPIFGPLPLNPLPLIYLGLQFAHMSMMPKSNDPQMAAQQRMMKIMPLVFVFIFYNMPAGLVLYFAVQSLLTIAEYFIMKFEKDDSVNNEATTAGVVPAGVGFKKSARKK